MRERIHQLDYLKGIFILLMVLFHLAPVYENYRVLQSAVYTFHMSAFLIISGYLANIEKDVPNFCRGMLRLVIPYGVFETVHSLLVYLFGSAMHANNYVASLTLSGILHNILAEPSNPYWYLHTLIISTFIYYVVYKVFKLKGISAFILTGLILYELTLFITKFQWENVIYFLIGVYISKSGRPFLEAIPASPLALIPLCILFSFWENYHRGSLAGIAITILVISFLLFANNYIGNGTRRLLHYLGSNSLAILVFSPIFTVITKMAVPYFSFDQTVICFAVLALIFVVAGCLFCAWLSDKLHLSQYLFAKDRFYVRY
jgi:fucose 4-O-acetylase-like acetyltransferase